MLKTVAGTTNEPEAELIVSRLAAAGIGAVSRRSTGDVEFGAGGGRFIYVEEHDEQRAREILATQEPPFSDEELTRLSEEAGPITEQD
jgi:Putative prokaryotic signal transducing protein